MFEIIEKIEIMMLKIFHYIKNLILENLQKQIGVKFEKMKRFSNKKLMLILKIRKVFKTRFNEANFIKFIKICKILKRNQLEHFFEKTMKVISGIN
jgi:hypothetical protein